MDNLIKIFAKNFIYGGLLMAFILTTIDVIKNSANDIAIYAFISGSFFILNLIQYYYINNNSNQNTTTFLVYSIIGGIVWVLYSFILYYLHTKNIGVNLNIFINSLIVILITLYVIYYKKLVN
jgi:hypothetical protein